MVAVSLLVAFIAGTLLYKSEKAKSAELAVAANRPALTRDHAPTLGPADAKVHIVEFLDPACETCREFYPFVKSLMAGHPEKIRLSVRHAWLSRHLPGLSRPFCIRRRICALFARG